MMDSSPPDLCPLEGRRTSRQLLTKLCIVNFAVLFAYTLLLKSRKEKYLNLKVVICFIWPLVAVWRVVLPVLGLFIDTIWR